MIIKEAELFRGVDHKTINEIARNATEEEGPAGSVIFQKDQPADYIFVLEEGEVDLIVGDMYGGGLHFVGTNPGEVFGWSAMIEPYVYTASARCMTDAKFIKIARDDLDDILRKYPHDGLMIMRHLAAVIAQRLRRSYENMAVATEGGTKPTATVRE